MNQDRIALPRYGDCFVCGCDNPAGLDVVFYYTYDRIEAEFTPPPRYSGFRDVTHGGVLATLMDECMGWASILSRPVMCVTAEMTIRYKSPAKAGEPLRAYSELIADKKRMILASGAIETLEGRVVCTGEGKFIPMSETETREVAEYAGWGDEFERLYQKIQAIRIDGGCDRSD